MAWVILAILFGVAAYYLLQYARKYKREHFDGGLKVIFVGSSWCSHCKTFAPEWDAAVKQLPGVNMAKLDADKDKAEITKLGVSAFPTILIVKDGANTEYRGPRTSDGIVQAVKAAQT